MTPLEIAVLVAIVIIVLLYLYTPSPNNLQPNPQSEYFTVPVGSTSWSGSTGGIWYEADGKKYWVSDYQFNPYPAGTIIRGQDVSGKPNYSDPLVFTDGKEHLTAEYRPWNFENGQHLASPNPAGTNYSWDASPNDSIPRAYDGVGTPMPGFETFEEMTDPKRHLKQMKRSRAN